VVRRQTTVFIGKKAESWKGAEKVQARFKGTLTSRVPRRRYLLPTSNQNAGHFRQTNSMSKLRLSIGRALSVAFAIGICAVGLYVAAAPVWSDWWSTKASAAEYEIGISDLQYAVKSTFRGANITDFPKGVVFTRFVTIPDSAKNWIRLEMTDRTPGFPETMSVEAIMQDLESSFLRPRPTFHLGSSIRAQGWPLLGGIALLSSGLSILGWMFCRKSIGRAASLTRKQIGASAPVILVRFNFWCAG